jgi:hypothetical protein
MSRPLHMLHFRVAVGDSAPLHLAVAHLAMSGEGEVAVWPADARDCAHPDLVRGAAPQRVAFAPAEWAWLRLLSPAVTPQQ